MAREEDDREDLLAEAGALVERIELRTPEGEVIVAGFRKNGAVSFFFGADPVYQFNPALELRRAFLAGEMLKAEDRKLVALRRERTVTEVVLARRQLSADAQADLIDELERRLTDLRAGLISGDIATVRQVPQNGEVRQRVLDWLDRRSSPAAIAESPRVSG